MSDKDKLRRLLAVLAGVGVLAAAVFGAVRCSQPSILAPEIDTGNETRAAAAAIDAIWLWDPTSDPHAIDVEKYGSADPAALIVTARLRRSGEVVQVAVDQRSTDGTWRAQGAPQPAADPTQHSEVQDWRGLASVPDNARDEFEAVEGFVPAYLTGDHSAARAWAAASWEPEPLAVPYDEATLAGVGNPVLWPAQRLAAWPITYRTTLDGREAVWHSWAIVTEEADGRWRMQRLAAGQPLPQPSDPQ